MNNQKVAILVDSCIDIPEHVREQYGMYLIPLKILYKDREYSDGIDISAEEVYTRLKDEIPTTSLPGAAEITDIFDRIKADGYEKVLGITLSSGLSGTFNLVTLLAKEYEGLQIEVIDTKNIAIAAGFNAIQAARYLEAGMNFEEVRDKVVADIYKAKVFFCVDTLEYLQKGGRIGLVASVLGTALNLKPIISCNEEGIYYNVAKIRGRKQSIQKVVDLAVQYAATGKKYNVALAHGAAAEEAQSIKDKLLEALPGCDIFLEGQISPVLGVHTGPGLIGVAIQQID
ncbi:MAG: DegV family protein [Cellulosilyticaceae bacterium]